MKIIKKVITTSSFFLIVFCILVSLTTCCLGVTQENSDITASLEEPELFSFSYENVKLDDIINEIAERHDLNVIFPQGELVDIKVTLHIDEKMTLSQTWDTLNTLLDVAGFCMVPQGNLIRIVKNGKEISREPMPTYIGVSPDQLPNNDQQIRYLCYLANIKVSDAPENELNGILKDLLPENAFYKADSVTNGLLLIGKASDIRSAMNIINELDHVNFQEKVDILALHHTSASIVAHLINEQLIKADSANPYRLDTKKAKDIPYFSGFTKIIPEVRLNKLIILGRPQAVERLKDFITKYIDVAPDSGKSILHVYRLQYLDAKLLAPVLEQIVQGGQGGGPSQASAGEATTGGIERFFDKVIIKTDSPINEGGDGANAANTKKERFTYYGGNNLIVAARNDDWKQIKKLIEELDIPQDQVLIEVLIADLTVEDSRLLGSMMRIPDKIPFPDSMEFQSAMLAVPPIPIPLPISPPNPAPITSIDSDLLSNAFTSSTTPTLAIPTSSGVKSVADFAASGTTLLSLNDNNGNTWSIWELLQVFNNSKILSHPHVIARNNKEAIVEIGQTRWLIDKVKDISGNYYGGATTINLKDIKANLKVQMTPRISSDDTVNLQVLVDINEFQALPTPGNTGNNTINIRKLETNATIKSGGIFALGGLIKTTTTDSLNEVPILSKIPILGWFFKSKKTDIVKNNLTVFICPTIIKPRLREGINEYTQDYINITKEYAQGNNFESLKDPITRWFFPGSLDTANAMDDFATQNEHLTATVTSIERKKQKKATQKQQTEADATKPTDVEVPETEVSINTRLQPHYNNNLKDIVRNDPNPFLAS